MSAARRYIDEREIEEVVVEEEEEARAAPPTHTLTRRVRPPRARRRHHPLCLRLPRTEERLDLSRRAATTRRSARPTDGCARITSSTSEVNF